MVDTLAADKLKRQ